MNRRENVRSWGERVQTQTFLVATMLASKAGQWQENIDQYSATSFHERTRKRLVQVTRNRSVCIEGSKEPHRRVCLSCAVSKKKMGAMMRRSIRCSLPFPCRPQRHLLRYYLFVGGVFDDHLHPHRPPQRQSVLICTTDTYICTLFRIEGHAYVRSMHVSTLAMRN